MPSSHKVTRRGFLRKAASAAVAGPMIMNAKAFGANDRFTMGCIGMGNRGRGVMNHFLGFRELEVVAVCDVVDRHSSAARRQVQTKYDNRDCRTYSDFREIIHRDDIDSVFIATPDHWHAIIAIEAMIHGKDVFCEKPETLTIREGRRMTKIARRYGRVFSGGSQRVWEDYNWFHKMVQGGAIGDVKEAWVNVGGPSGTCYLEPHPVPQGVDWDMWLGPAPARPFHPQLIKGEFRPFRDYSGGGMTDWGCHAFGGVMFCLGLHETGPVEVIPPDGKDYTHLTYKFANGVKVYHGGGWDGIMNFRGTEGEISEKGDRNGVKREPPDIHIPNYRGHRGLCGDFVHCVGTRERPFRDIELGHRTATVSHLGNIAYWLNRRVEWDPVNEQIVNDAEANRWLDRQRREPWSLS